MARIMGLCKIHILAELERLGGEFEKPRGGWWSFYLTVGGPWGASSAYASYFYRHLKELIYEGAVEDEGAYIRLTAYGRALLAAYRERGREIGRGRVIIYDPPTPEEVSKE